MKICAYVQNAYAKANYKNECMDTRQFFGLRIIIDSLARAGYTVEWAGAATVHEYDLVLVSLTSDCDWWTFIAERVTWRKGDYKVIVGGAGVLHVAPFLKFADYFSLGRGENSIVNLVRKLDGKDAVDDDSIVESATFSADKIYHIRQTDFPYPHEIMLEGYEKGRTEGPIGCPHKCLFCGYTWQRKFVSDSSVYKMTDGLFGIEDKERAMLDIDRDPESIDFAKLRTTAIDGMSERLRFMVNKRISREMMVHFLTSMLDSGAAPHYLKLYNIVGYPGETPDDWQEYKNTIMYADAGRPHRDKQWGLVLHSTPFRPMPATPLACAPVAKRNFRGEIARVLGPEYQPGHVLYKGSQLWSSESLWTDGLSTVMLSILALRGAPDDAENIERLCRTKKFWGASAGVKEATLCKFFDMDEMFGEYTPETLPSRYLRTYCAVEKSWARPPWKPEFAIKPPTCDEARKVQQGTV